MTNFTPTHIDGAPWTLCVYCAASTADPVLIGYAREVGAAIAQRGWNLVSGGGRVSMMGAVAQAARAGGAGTVGVIPTALVDREMADIDSDELVVVQTMRERKLVMDERSDAFLALPGGIGTLEELFEVWTAKCLGMHSKPVVIYDPTGHYDGLLSWLAELVNSAVVSQSSLDTLIVCSTLNAALDACVPADEGSTPSSLPEGITIPPGQLR